MSPQVVAWFAMDSRGGGPGVSGPVDASSDDFSRSAAGPAVTPADRLGLVADRLAAGARVG
jgi:hypothetical protein